MKNLLFGLALSVAVSAPAFAGEQMSKEQFCAELETEAVAIMSARQSGVPISKVLALVDNEGIHKHIVMDAYDQHAMQTPENAANQRAEFGVKWAVFCIKNR
ncbi:MAG TPA: hypothetical protein VFC74_06110 [Oscillospiraceae bacterium]|nr:hypothetical protein [Oscillospiraceae bacterium]